jgi:predicted RNA-binding protein with PIN domain
MFYLGGMIRAAEHQLGIGGDSELEAARDEVMAKLEEYDAFLKENYEVKAHPIRNLVGMSLGSILHSVEYVKSKKLWY